jgi:hypothetical protein
LLWIDLGLKVKEGKLNAAAGAIGDARRASEEWVRRLGWDGDTLQRKAEAMQELVDSYARA